MRDSPTGARGSPMEGLIHGQDVLPKHKGCGRGFTLRKEESPTKGRRSPSETMGSPTETCLHGTGERLGTMALAEFGMPWDKTISSKAKQ